MNVVTNVSAGKPKIGGAIFVADIGATLPTNPTSDLVGFTGLGYVSEDGLTNMNDMTINDIHAWGGDLVLTTLEEKTDAFQFTLIEVLNRDVLKVIYGDENVGVTNNVIGVTVNSEELPEKSWVFDMIMRENRLKRIVVPRARVTEIGDVVYTDNDAVGYEITITAMPDVNGNTHYEYISPTGEL